MKASTPVTKDKPKTRPIFKLLAALLIILFAVSLFSQKDVAPTEAKIESSPISIDAEKLWADYKENEVSADGLYKGKTLIVAGVVQSVNKDFKDEVWVGLKTDNQFMPIHAVGLNVAQASALRSGQVVAFICTGDGMVMGSPFLKECRKPHRGKT